MFTIKRRKLGTVYDKSPAQLVRKWVADNVSKLVFAIIGCGIWLFVLFSITGIVNFLGGRVAETWSRDLSVMELYNHPYMVPVKLIGAVLVVLYVFRDIRKR
jgi:hypothetical protein